LPFRFLLALSARCSFFILLSTNLSLPYADRVVNRELMMQCLINFERTLEAEVFVPTDPAPVLCVTTYTFEALPVLACFNAFSMARTFSRPDNSELWT
jgi:hypothetical protein